MPPDSGSIRSRADLLHNPAILVFQDYVLFPTMTVFDNVAFGLKTRKVEKAAMSDKVMAMLDYFGLADKARQFPGPAFLRPAAAGGTGPGDGGQSLDSPPR